ncbi:outer membrane protein TolC [Larkinella arboricola]|uniref:Outer membrane protein TolC n=1 Tax=Larkinella arboricola TaxID=643671 RepID=A0A327X5F7_LARAB|nr:outer membrane protein TolC [Larkinella arboricola]
MTPLLLPNKPFLLLLLTGLLGSVMAQTPRDFSLNDAIHFATQQNINVKNTQLDALSAEARIREVKGLALPQVNVGASATYNAIIQKFIFPAGGFGAPVDSTATGGASSGDDVTAIPFGVKYQGSVAANVNQLIFDASYKIGLRAAATYRELAQKNITASKITVAEQVAKAYYGVLVSEERLKLLDINISRVDTLLRETRAMNTQGFVEKIDIDRLEVQLNNLKTDRQNVKNLVDLSYNLLKFQMGLPINAPIQLTDRIEAYSQQDLERAAVLDSAFDYGQRIEFSTLQTQITLADLDYQSIGKQYYPRLTAAATYGHNNGRNNFMDFWTTQWFNSAAITLNLNVPIFDGFQKRYAAQQRKIAIDKARQTGELLKNSIDLQIRQATVTLTNNLQTLQSQKRNMDLAQEIVRVTRIKYKEGVGSNIEVLNAETSFREAQTNYFSALLDYMITKVDLDKALGKLYTGQ